VALDILSMKKSPFSRSVSVCESQVSQELDVRSESGRHTLSWESLVHPYPFHPKIRIKVVRKVSGFQWVSWVWEFSVALSVCWDFSQFTSQSVLWDLTTLGLFTGNLLEN
jgi:hypothetical protein